MWTRCGAKAIAACAPKVLHAAALALAVLQSLGCTVVTYQPVSGLQRPTVISPQVSNFDGRRIVIRCLPNEYIAQKHAQRLCNHVRTLFVRQGASVDVALARATATDAAEPAAAADMVVELHARLLHEERNFLLSILSGFTLTLVPTIREFTFIQNVIVLDRDGFQLASDTLQGRFVEYFGVGVWGVNKILDATVRPDDEHLTGNVAQQDFSKDFDRQLSQIAFNAHMRAQVMRSFEDPGAAAAPVTPTPSAPETR